MSRAFVREDVDPPERPGRRRSSSGLPPGAINYITARGARRLREQVSALRNTEGESDGIAELEHVLESVTIVDPPEPGTGGIPFGSTVTVEKKDGSRETFTIVGLDELAFEPDGVTWISPIGKSLLAAELGQRVVIGEEPLGKIVAVKYRA
jgi:transcription elongation GreA/GreB family factor